MLGYLVVGVLIGPNALALAKDSTTVAVAAELGVVFLMFVIGLEFNLPRLRSMRTLVFGLGLSQVVLTVLGTLAGHFLLVAFYRWLTGESWEMSWLVADAGGAAQERGAVRPEPAARHARAGVAHRARGPEPRAGRLRRRHAGGRDRIQAPGRDRHPAVPRRAAGPVLHHDRDEARLAARARAVGAGAAADHAAGAGQSGAGGSARVDVQGRAGRGAAHRPVPGAGRRVRFRAADARHRAGPGGAAVDQPGAGEHGAQHAGHAVPHPLQQPHRQQAGRQRLDDAVGGDHLDRPQGDGHRAPRDHLRLRP